MSVFQNMYIFFSDWTLGMLVETWYKWEMFPINSQHAAHVLPLWGLQAAVPGSVETTDKVARG